MLCAFVEVGDKIRGGESKIVRLSLALDSGGVGKTHW